jgi:hypothetical protein
VIRLHIKFESGKGRATKKKSRNDQNSECFPIADHSEIEYLWHCDVPEPLEDGHQHEEDDYTKGDE